MPLFRPRRPPEQPSVPRASTSTPQSTPRPQPPSIPRSVLGSTSHHDPPADKDTRLARMKKLAGDTLEIVQTTSSMAAEATADVAVPGLSIALSALSEILRRIMMMKTTVEGVEMLVKRVETLTAKLQRFCSRPRTRKLQEDMLARIEGLIATWTSIEERARKIKSAGVVKRFFTSDADAKKLEGLIAEISSSIHDDFLLEQVLSIEENVGIILEDVAVVREEVDVVRGDVEIVRSDVGLMRSDVGLVREDMRDIHDDTKTTRAHLDTAFMPTYAKKAQYDAGDMVRRPCLEGTRVGLLTGFQDWITTACTQKDQRHKHGSVLWISGLAGTGKTTVAYSIAEWADRQDLLGGSFFCSRFDSECNDPTFVFVTIARQLCGFHEPFKKQVMEVLRKNPGVVNSRAARQFEELIVGPLEALQALGIPFPPCVLVFDALDECRNEASAFVNATSTIMTVVARFIPRIDKFLTFVFTSRPEPSITPLFRRAPTETLEGLTTTVVLHLIELELVEGDIRKYLVDGFGRISKVYQVPPDWPSPQDVDKLVKLANGLFIFISTAVAFMMARASLDPPSRLQNLVSIGASAQPSTTILDELYSEIISASYAEMSHDLESELQKVLGCIVLAQEPLSVSTLAGLLGLPVYKVDNMLSGLHSVLHIPANHLDPILVIHPTFPEFILQTPQRTTATSLPSGHPFHVQPAQQHWFMFSRCLEAMAFLKRDMIGIRYPAKFRSEIPNLAKVIQNAIPQYVRYASRYWAVHLCEGLGDPNKPDMSSQLRGFVHEQILFWLEACIVLGIPAAHALNTVSKACRTLGNAVADLVPLLVDCRRFIQTYSSATHTAPLQLYHFALGIAPIASGFRGLYARELEHSIVVCQGALSHWSPSLDRFVGHGGEAIYSVAFSYNGSCFASGGEDNQVIVWDSASRTELQSFDGHTGLVICIAFSPDGAHIASGSEDRTVCIWQVSSGARVHTLEGHTDDVHSVAYSADGRRVLSATDEGEVKLWDTADWRCVFALEKTGTYTWQAALSPNGDVLARGEGTSLVLRDVSSATHEALSLPDEVEACTFSLDGRYVAARTEHAIRVWATADKALVRSIGVPDSTLSSRLAFSPDGKYIACGSQRGAVYVWEVASQDSPYTLNGHKNEVQDVAWSPDGLQLASAADDGTIRLWDGALHSSAPETSAASAHQPAPPGPPRYALIQYKDSATHVHLPSLGIDNFPANPRLRKGAPTVTAFTDVVAACDATLQYGDRLWSSSDRARNWAFLTGQQHTKLGWRPVAISRDGSRLAYPSPTSDKVVDVCDLCSGIVVASLKGHTEDVRSIVFSPDGTRLATGSMDETVKVWDATTGALICGHAEHRHRVCTTAFSSDGRLVASGSWDGTVRVFDVAAERVEHVLGPHDKWVIEVMFTVDDDHIVALDHSDQVVIWEVATGSRIYSFSFRTHDWPRSLTFSSNTVGICIHSDAEERTIGVRKTSTQPITLTEVDGWVYAMLPGVTHRLCWLPPEWRTVLGSEGGTLYLKEAKSNAHPHGRGIAIDMSRLIAYIDNLPPDPA